MEAFQELHESLILIKTRAIQAKLDKKSLRFLDMGEATVSVAATLRSHGTNSSVNSDICCSKWIQYRLQVYGN